ncbi:exocyst complex component Sec6-domain-containing protein [Lipomyces arxii]|uniref:exocyst complex component Sec6-domain-containing protein n=1 Tax=Lipomyces arxii TaxID=56418 RepID=UPI0034CF9822
MAEPTESAVSSLAELLRYPDDLSKISTIKERLIREKAAVDLELKTATQTQLDVITNGLNNLLDSKTLANEVSQELMKTDLLCRQAASMVSGFSQINKVSIVRRNFMAVEDVMRNISNLPNNLDEIEALIEADGTDVFGPMTNFLAVHYKLSGLRDFRDQAMFQASKAGIEVQKTLLKYFARLDNVVKEFDEILFLIAQNLLEMLREGNSSLVIRWAKVLDVDERLDENVKIMTTTSAFHRDPASHLSMSGQSTAMARELRNYGDRLTEAIKSGVKGEFENCLATFPDDPSDLLDNLYWVIREVLFASEHLAKFVPERWRIADRYLAAYHMEMYNLLKSLVNKDTEAGLLLKIVRWSQKYNETMVREGKFPKEKLVPPLLDGQEDNLLGDYMRLICLKTNEWMSNLAKTEFAEFAERKQEPDADPESKYGLANTPIVFQMINQQITVAIDSDEIRVVSGVIQECKRQILQRQQRWVNCVQTEIQKSNANPDDVPGGLVEYSIAVANDQVRGADYVESIISKQINVNADVLVHSEEERGIQSQMAQDLEVTMDGFIATAKLCVLEIVGMAIFDLQPTFASLFKEAWYTPSVSTTAADGTITTTPGSVVIQEVIRTFEEYNAKLSEHLNPDLLNIYVDDLLEATLVAYLSAVSKNKNVTLSARSLDQIKNDVALLYPFFTAFTDSEHVESQFISIEILMGLVSSDRIGTVEEFRTMKESFPDAPLRFVEDVLRAREDLDLKTVKEYIDAVRSDSIANGAGSSDRRTYMSRLYA